VDADPESVVPELKGGDGVGRVISMVFGRVVGKVVYIIVVIERAVGRVAEMEETARDGAVDSRSFRG
jgi:hypothetical protein